MHSITINKKLDYLVHFTYLPSLTLQKIHKTADKPEIKSAVAPKKMTPAPATQVKPPTTTATASVKPYSAKASKATFATTANVKSPVQPPAINNKPEPFFAKAPADKLAKALDIKQTVVPIKQVEDTKKPQISPPATEVPVQNAIVSNNFREVEALRRGAQLQKELVQKWQPPIGVSPECTCEISFFVNNAGKIENLKMVKNSGVIMFDISARQALFSMKMPQWTHGKPLTINFKQ